MTTANIDLDLPRAPGRILSVCIGCGSQVDFEQAYCTACQRQINAADRLDPDAMAEREWRARELRAA
jgi:predicted amidophosphoribosyltransferase